MSKLDKKSAALSPYGACHTEDIVSFKSSKTVLQKAHQPSTSANIIKKNSNNMKKDASHKNLTDRLSNVAHSAKIEANSISTNSVLSKELLSVLRFTEKNQQVIQRFQKGPSRKKMMNLAISHINGSNLDEFNRIKKPLKQAQIIGKLLCVMVQAFRVQNLGTGVTFETIAPEFEKWENIQCFLCTNPTKILLEIGQIKSKAKHVNSFNMQLMQRLID